MALIAQAGCNQQGFACTDRDDIQLDKALLGSSQVAFYVLEGAKDLDSIASISGCRLHNPDWTCHQKCIGW